MSTATIPKSEMRRSNNIRVGLGEVPAKDFEGITCWGLPGNKVTFSEEEALGFAVKLDKEIRSRMIDINQLQSV